MSRVAPMITIFIQSALLRHRSRTATRERRASTVSSTHRAERPGGEWSLRHIVSRLLPSTFLAMSHHYSGPEFGSPHDDARLDFTDLYAFPKPGDGNASILIMNVHPSVNVKPPGPTTTDPFSPDA